MARMKSRAAAETVVAARNPTEAAAMVAKIGEHMRERILIQAALSEEVELARRKAEELLKPHTEQIAQMTRSVQLWAEANRAALTQDGRKKTIELTTGKLSWRAKPPSVRIRDVTAALQALVEAGLDRFIRTKHEPNREAMLAEPEVAVTVPGITIGSAGEEFAVEPAGIELIDGAGPA